MVILDDRPWAVRALDALDQAAPGGAGRWLAPLGRLYALGGRLRRLARAEHFPPQPLTVGIGNLRVGGTGKTPVTAELARLWRARGRCVAVVSRGYRAGGGGDEPEWLRQEGLSLILDADRRRGVRRAGDAGAEIVLLDDALQSLHVAHQLLAIVLDRDLRHPPRPLPAGPAREDASALGRADALLVRMEEGPWPPAAARRAQLVADARRHGLSRVFPFRLTPHTLLGPLGERASLEVLPELGPVLLVSGLARPQSFERDSMAAGAAASACYRLADHCDPGARERERLLGFASATGATTLLCPEKNRARLARLDIGLPLWAIRSQVEWSESDPVDFLEGRLSLGPLDGSPQEKGGAPLAHRPNP